MKWRELTNRISKQDLIRLILNGAIGIIIGMIGGLIVVALIGLFFWSDFTGFFGRILLVVWFWTWAKYGIICGGILGATIAVLRVANVSIIKPQTLLFLTCVGSITLIVLWVYYYFFPSSIYPFSVNRDDWNSVESTFTDAMLDNDSWTAKSLTIPSEWDKIDNWVGHHIVFKCPPSEEWGLSPYSGVASSDNKNGPINSFSHYRCFKKPYNFSINVILEQTKEGWTVTKIVDICEKQSWDTACN
jgi:hypothetical protein